MTHSFAHVLERYGVTDATLERLSSVGNETFRVTNSSGESFLLRAHAPGRHSVGAITSELLWLEYLHAQNFEVQQPVLLEGGGFVLELDGRFYTLLSWLDGEVLESLNEQQAWGAGVLMARLNEQARTFAPPPGFIRPTYDPAHFGGILARLQALEWLKPELPLLEQATEQVKEIIRADITTPILIHADYHAGNLVVNSHRLSVIDFDLMGFGSKSLDLATALFFLELEGLQAAFLEGYRTISSLEPNFKQVLGSYTLAAYLENLSFLAERSEEREFLERGFLPELKQVWPNLLVDRISL